MLEHRADERERRGHQRRAEHAEQGAPGDQGLGRRAERGTHRGEAEPERADEQKTPPADPVA
jgi:hypothetical protein